MLCISKAGAISGFRNPDHRFPVLFITDFNDDLKNDIILFNKSENKITIHSSNKLGYSNPEIKFFYFPISFIAEFGINDNNDKQYLFISRKEQLAGLFSITKFGTLQLLNIIQFKSIPSKISTITTKRKNKNSKD